MKLKHSITLRATRQQIFEAMKSSEFFKEVEDELNQVSSIRLVSLDDLPDGRIRRTVRYTAPTQLPRFLKRYEDKAPDEIHWDEITDLDPERGHMRFEIRPDAPGHWHEKYENEGHIYIREKANGTSEVERTLEYSVSFPGMGFVLERALRPEIDAILTAQDRVLQRRF